MNLPADDVAGLRVWKLIFTLRLVMVNDKDLPENGFSTTCFPATTGFGTIRMAAEFLELLWRRCKRVSVTSKVFLTGSVETRVSLLAP